MTTISRYKGSLLGLAVTTQKKDNLVIIEDIYDVPLTQFSSRL